MKTKKFFIVFWLIAIYTLLVVLFAMPLQKSVTVYRDKTVEPPVKIIKKALTPRVVTSPQVKNLPVPVKVSPEKAQLVAFATKEAEINDLDPKMFVEIINCESSYNPNAVHDGGHGKGVTGFWKETFNRWNKQFFNGTLDYTSQEDQIKLMARVFQEGEEYRNDWSSWNKYKKYGSCFNYQIKKIKKT